MRPRRLSTLSLITLWAASLPAQFGGPMSVEIAEVRTEMLGATVYLTGDVAARRESLIGSEVEGKVEEVFVEEGSAVSAEATLLQIDTALLELAVQRDQARLQAAQARLESARIDFESQSQLIGDNIISQTAFAVVEAEYLATGAAVAEIEAELELSQERLRRASIRAPYAGTVGRVEAEAGEWLQEGGDVLVLVETSALEVVVEVAETQVAQVRPGLHARVLVDGLPGQEFDGEVLRIEPLPDLTNRTYPVHLRINDADPRILPGMFARVAVQTQLPRETTLMPADALVDRGRGTEVWVITEGLEGLTAAPRRVEVGLRRGERIEVIRGLEPGDQVVTAGYEMLIPGASVVVAGAAGSSEGAAGEAQ